MDRSKKLGQKSVLSLLLEFSIPSIIGMLVSALYNVIDRVFIGNSVGELGIAAVTIAFPIMTLQMAFGGLIGMGATANISIKLGQNDAESAKKIAGNAFILLIATSVVFTVLGLIFLDPMLRLFGASNEVMPYARQYVNIILYGSIFMLMSFGLNNMIRAEGRPVTAMMTMLIGTLLNVILAPIFIFVFNWGMQGAALATVCAQCVSATWIVLHFVRGKGLLRLRRKNMRLDGGIINEILVLGVSTFALQSANTILSVVLNNVLAAYGGDVAISGMGIVNSVTTLMILPAIGINQGAQPIIGYNYGARKFRRVRETLVYAIIANTILTTAGFVLTHLIPTQLISIFDSTDKELIAFGTHALTIFLVCMPIVGYQIAGSGFFLSIGKPKQSMLLSMSRQILFLIPLAIILPNFFGLNGALYAGPISDALAASVTTVWLVFELKGMKRHEAEIERMGKGDSQLDLNAVSADSEGT
jgi:putative MATE family efflux protein